MYKSVETFDEPRGILGKMRESYVEMSSSDHGFLCGLIRKNRPKKVLEVGVAGGGTTAVIMNCLSMTGNKDAIMYSVDLNEECYRRERKRTGWQLEEVRDYLDNYQNHTFLLGKRLPQVVHELGDDIDMVVLDTVHALPGEMLDFLCIYPHLSENAIVVLHDVTNNFIRFEHSIATKILLDSVSGEKYFNLTDGLPNIGAFRITQETWANIENVFSALSITWCYLESLETLIEYRKQYQKFYPEECLKLFDQIVRMQYQSYARNRIDVNGEINRFLQICGSGRKLYLYGAGIRGNQLRKFILSQGFRMDGFIISDDYKPEDFTYLNTEIYRISEMPEEEYDLILATPAPEVFLGLLKKEICFEFFSEKFFERIAELERQKEPCRW